MTRRTLVAALLLMSTSALLRAHGGMIHVMGTVTGLTDTSVTVETTEKKTVEVFLTTATTFLNGSTPSSRKELKVGDRVVIHAVKEKDALQAHEVRFSQAKAASARP
jgi:Domain of unknown function (DUF5666)